MNRSSKTLALIAVTLASSLATAQTLPARTRADVVAELRAAQASGELQAERLQAEGVGYLLGTPALRKASTASAATASVFMSAQSLKTSWLPLFALLPGAAAGSPSSLRMAALRVTSV